MLRFSHTATSVSILGWTPSGVPEMRAQNIELSVSLCMNLPYTTAAEEAADAVPRIPPKDCHSVTTIGGSDLGDIQKRLEERIEVSAARGGTFGVLPEIAIEILGR